MHLVCKQWVCVTQGPAPRPKILPPFDDPPPQRAPEEPLSTTPRNDLRNLDGGRHRLSRWLTALLVAAERGFAHRVRPHFVKWVEVGVRQVKHFEHLFVRRIDAFFFRRNVLILKQKKV